MTVKDKRFVRPTSAVAPATGSEHHGVLRALWVEFNEHRNRQKEPEAALDLSKSLSRVAGRQSATLG